MFILGVRDCASVVSALFLHIIWIAVFAVMWLNGAIAIVGASFVFLLLVAAAYSKWFVSRHEEVNFNRGFTRESAFPTSNERKKLVSIVHWLSAAVAGVLAYVHILFHAVEPSYDTPAVAIFLSSILTN